MPDLPLCLTRRTAIRPHVRAHCRVLIAIRYSAGYDSGGLHARSVASNDGCAALWSFRLMGLPNRINGGSSPGRLRNTGLCHFPLDVAKTVFVGFFLLIFLQRHKTIMSRPEKQERSVRTSSSGNLPPQGQVEVLARYFLAVHRLPFQFSSGPASCLRLRALCYRKPRPHRT